jgi:hypothetical protein
MISFWQALLMMVVAIIAVYGAFYSGFWFGYHVKKEVPPTMPIDFSEIGSKAKKDDDDESLGFYDH